MKKYPIIGIVASYDKERMLLNNSRISEIGENYIKVINEYGGIPVGILPVQDIFYTDVLSSEVPELTINDKERLISSMSNVDGILITGGNRWYEFDEFICKQAYDSNIPVLGICRGMQIMAYVMRQESFPDPKTFLIESTIDHQNLMEKYAHDVSIDTNSLLYDILGTPKLKVNSRHKFSIGDRNINNKVTISAVADDGVIEAIEDKSKTFFLGVQWHPEIMDAYDNIQGNIIKKFIDYCSK